MSHFVSRSGQLVACVVILSVGVAWGATPEQRRQVNALAPQIAKAGAAYQKKNFKESGELVKGIQEKVEELAATGDADLLKLLEPVHARLKSAHDALKAQGVELAALKDLKAGANPAPAANPNPANPAVAAPAALPANGLSFTKHVAPILVAKCGNCHINKQSGMFSAATFSALMKGSKSGKVIFPKDADGSRIVEVIEQGDMPRGGLKVSPQELAAIKTWIKEGAAYDGNDPEQMLVSLVGDVKAAAPVQVAVAKATGKETISFAKDIAPHLAKSCNGCHIGAQMPRGRLNMATFASFLKGGESGPPIMPGKPADSLLVHKLKGTGGGERMPAGGREPFSSDVMAKIEKWIAEGATFDGLKPEQPIVQVAALAKARSSSHDELAAERAKLAADNWQRVMPDVKASSTETKNFVVYGQGEATVADFAEQAEALAPKIASMFHASSDPLIKGRMSLFFLPQRYEYGEFGRMIEERTLPESWRGHWGFSVIDAYGAMAPSKTDAYSTKALIGQQIAGAYVASLGSTPQWFAEGCGRAAAAQLDPKDARVAAWDVEVASVVGAFGKPDEFMHGKLGPEEVGVASYSFVKYLMGKSYTKKFETLMASLAKGEEFNAAFTQAYGGSPTQAAEAWSKMAGKETPVAGKRPPLKRPGK